MNRLEAISSSFLQDPDSIWFVAIFVGVILLAFWFGHILTRPKNQDTFTMVSRKSKKNDFDEPWR